MPYLIFLGFIVVMTFGLVVFVGPPWLPTLAKNTEAALDLLDLKPGQFLLELGSGDGRVMVAAAKRGVNVTGIELNLLLVLYSYLRTWRYRKHVRIIWGNYFSRAWPYADGVFTFMLPRLMGRLDSAVKQWEHRPVKLASFAFKIPGKEPVAEQAGVFLYEYK